MKKTKTQLRAERIETLAKLLVLPKNVGTSEGEEENRAPFELPMQSFADPDPFQEFAFPTILAAKRAIADYLGCPLAKLTDEQMAYVNKICNCSLNKAEILTQVQAYFNLSQGNSSDIFWESQALREPYSRSFR
ncbi:hypothetical protein QUA13_29720 [Microcoleus sp. S28C3]|uniref:hypothetical protein n=1 Tax=Microcoleus sp. S28C3 TaxID=3055414 RepID=UPI002FD6F627